MLYTCNHKYNQITDNYLQFCCFQAYGPHLNSPSEKGTGVLMNKEAANIRSAQSLLRITI